jgi:hypothetical protein
MGYTTAENFNKTSEELHAVHCLWQFAKKAQMIFRDIAKGNQ